MIYLGGSFGNAAEYVFQHDLISCDEFSGWKWRIQDFREDLGEPRVDTCCFRCFLPTRVCRGPLEIKKGKNCRNKDLIILFWLVSGFKDLTWNNSSLNPWAQVEMPADLQLSSFLKEKWELDTEIIQAAWFFYQFSKQFYKIYSFRV